VSNSNIDGRPGANIGRFKRLCEAGRYKTISKKAAFAGENGAGGGEKIPGKN